MDTVLAIEVQNLIEEIACLAYIKIEDPLEMCIENRKNNDLNDFTRLIPKILFYIDQVCGLQNAVRSGLVIHSSLLERYLTKAKERV